MDTPSYITFIVYLEEDELRNTARLLETMAESYAENSVIREASVSHATPPVGFPGGAPGTSIHTPPAEEHPTPPAPPASPAPPVPPAPLVTPPAPPAPPAPPETPPVSSTGVEVDSTGLPWDARIHSANHQQLKTGPWRKKRGVSPTFVTQVETELRGAMAAPPAADGSPPAPPAPPAADGSPPAPPASLAADGSPPAPPAVVGPPKNMQQLVSRITLAGLDTPTVEAACQLVGVETLPLLGTRPDLVPTVAEHLGLI